MLSKNVLLLFLTAHPHLYNLNGRRSFIGNFKIAVLSLTLLTINIAYECATDCKLTFDIKFFNYTKLYFSLQFKHFQTELSKRIFKALSLSISKFEHFQLNRRQLSVLLFELLYSKLASGFVG